MTTREIIINSLHKGIKELNLFKKVFIWRTKSINSKDVPAVDIRDTKDNVEDKNLSARHYLGIELTILTEEGERTRERLLEYVNSILKKIEELDNKNILGEYAELIRVDLEIAQEKGIFGVATIEIKALYNSSRWEI
jgi:hypothetical protein